MSILSDSEFPRQGQLVNPSQPVMTSLYGKEVSIRCECCYGEMIDPLNEASITWRSEQVGDNMLYTGFHITHRSGHCIDNLFKGAARSLWMPVDWFFQSGAFSLDWFIKPRYDDDGNLIDYDLRIDRAALERVAIALRQITPPKAPKKQKQNKEVDGRAGYVYLVQSPTGTYKIGRTKDPADRMKTFSIKLPFEVEYVCVIPTDDRYRLESELHKRFKSQRVNGEFFRLSASDIEYIKGLVK